MKKIIWDEMRRMQRRMNRFWQGYDENPWDSGEEDLAGYRKAWIDAREDEDSFVIAVELPGVDKKDIELNVDGDSVTIKVEKKSEEKEENRYERRYFGFYRRIPMPENAELEKIDAEYSDGVLKMRIQKREKGRKKGREIRIR